jgi:hypothetical protein
LIYSFDYSGENRYEFTSSRSTVGMEYDIGSNESVTSAVIRAVSAVEGRKPCSLQPLADVLDPDALDELFASRPGGRSRSGGRISFIYSNCRVTIDNGEYLTLQPLEYRLHQSNGQEPTRSAVEEWSSGK